MVVYGRVFAGELANTTLKEVNGVNTLTEQVITPGGACISYILIAGALTRVIRSPAGSLNAWVSDPTGTFTLSCPFSDATLTGFFQKAEPPVFVSVTGEIRYSRGKGSTVQVRPISAGIVDRTVRDSWVIRTAELTLERLETLREAVMNGTSDPILLKALAHYRTDEPLVRSLADMVGDALSKVNGVSGDSLTPADPREIILDLIKSCSGPRGIPVTELVGQAAARGIREDQVLTTVKQLVEDDDCYQPVAGTIKLL